MHFRCLIGLSEFTLFVGDTKNTDSDGLKVVNGQGLTKPWTNVIDDLDDAKWLRTKPSCPRHQNGKYSFSLQRPFKVRRGLGLFEPMKEWAGRKLNPFRGVTDDLITG